MAVARFSSAALAVIAFSVALSSVSGQTGSGTVVGAWSTWNSPEFDYQAWADGITFHIGDALIFQYDVGVHGVVVADSEEAFNQCRLYPNYGFYESGLDTLVMNDPGIYYFMCQYNCLDNMKFKVSPKP